MNPPVLQISIWIMLPFSLLLPIIAALCCYRKYNPAYMRTFPIYCVVNALADVSSVTKFHTFPIIPIFTALETIYFAYFLTRVLRSRAVKVILWGLVVPFVIAVMYFSFSKDSYFTYYWLIISECLILIFPCCFYFIEALKRPKPFKPSKEPALWMVTGILYYFLLLLFTYLIADYLWANNEHYQAQEVYSVNNYAQFVSFSLYIYAMLCRRSLSY